MRATPAASSGRASAEPVCRDRTGRAAPNSDGRWCAVARPPAEGRSPRSAPAPPPSATASTCSSPWAASGERADRAGCGRTRPGPSPAPRYTTSTDSSVRYGAPRLRTDDTSQVWAIRRAAEIASRFESRPSRTAAWVSNSCLVRGRRRRRVGPLVTPLAPVAAPPLRAKIDALRQRDRGECELLWPQMSGATKRRNPSPSKSSPSGERWTPCAPSTRRPVPVRSVERDRRLSGGSWCLPMARPPSAKSACRDSPISSPGGVPRPSDLGRPARLSVGPVYRLGVQ
jgi:hypothetical protein